MTMKNIKKYMFKEKEKEAQQLFSFYIMSYQHLII